MRVLVTGVAGFLGSHLADRLLAHGHDVVGIDNLIGGRVTNIPELVTFVQGDVCDQRCVDDVFEAYHPDVVFHLAAYAAEGFSHFAKRFNYHNNLVGSVTLLNAAIIHSVRLFAFASSIAVYGSAPCPMKESTQPMPEDPYGIAKYAFELDLEATRDMFGLPYIVFRPHNVYGERQNIADPYRNVVGIFIRQSLEGVPLTLFGDGSQVRAFTHVDDVSDIMARSVNMPSSWNQVFNIGADRTCEVRELAAIVAKYAGGALKCEHLDSRKEVTCAYADHSKARSTFDCQPRVDLETGIQRMYEWNRVRGVPTVSPIPPAEVTIGLPAVWQNTDGKLSSYCREKGKTDES
jgi:UDP-glucose 4-epimerase